MPLGNTLNVIISCSLNAESRSFQLAKYAKERLPNSTFIDMKEYKIPSFEEYYKYQYLHTDLEKLHNIISSSSGIIFVFPIYNWGAPALARYLVEILGTNYQNVIDGNAFSDKVVGCICVGSLSKGFLSPLGFLNSLMVAFHCKIIPNYVFAAHEDLADEQKFSEVKSRISLLTDKLVEATQKEKAKKLDTK